MKITNMTDEQLDKLLSGENDLLQQTDRDIEAMFERYDNLTDLD